MSNYLTIDRNYTDHDILFAADLDDICKSVMTFVNTTKLNEDNLSASITDLFLETGMIVLFGDTSVPSGWLLCDGSVLDTTTYADLYAVIGSTYNTGGEGVGNFRLPDYRRYAPVGMGGSGTGTLGNALGNRGGEETHTLDAGLSTIPNHTHTDVSGHAHFERNTSTSGGTINQLQVTSGAGAAANSPLSTSTTTGITYNNTGGGTAHNNMQPSLVIGFIIKV